MRFFVERDHEPLKGGQLVGVEFGPQPLQLPPQVFELTGHIAVSSALFRRGGVREAFLRRAGFLFQIPGLLQQLVGQIVGVGLMEMFGGGPQVLNAASGLFQLQ